MKKTLWIACGLLAIVLIWAITTYNSFVNKEAKMAQAWSQVENVYQRRMQLIPDLIDVIKAYSEYESTTLVEVVEKRAQQAASVKVYPESMTEEQLLGFNQTQQLLDDAVSDVIVSIENYPELKTAELYQTFLAQYKGSENRIKTERQRFNESVKEYNSAVRRFPSSLIASLFGFEPRPYFEVEN